MAGLVKRFAGRLRGRGQSSSEPDVTAHPTPIRISRRTALILAVLRALFDFFRVRLTSEG